MNPGPSSFIDEMFAALAPNAAENTAPAAEVAETGSFDAENVQNPAELTENTAPAAEKPVAEPKLDDVESRFAKLSAASAKVQAERKQLAAEREAQKAEWAEYQEYKKAKELASEDPEGWARLGGFDRADVFAAKLIDKGTLTPERRKILELEQNNKKQQEWIQSFEQKQAAAQAAAAEAEDMRIVREFGQQPDVAERFDLVNRFNAHNLVIGEIKAHYQHTLEAYGEGEMMSIEEAYAKVEDRLDREIAPALESPKYRSRFGQPAPAARAPGAPASTPATRKPQGTTVTGQMRAQTAPPRQQSEVERLEEAYNIFFAPRR